MANSRPARVCANCFACIVRGQGLALQVATRDPIGYAAALASKNFHCCYRVPLEDKDVTQHTCPEYKEGLVAEYNPDARWDIEQWHWVHKDTGEEAYECEGGLEFYGGDDDDEDDEDDDEETDF